MADARLVVDVVVNSAKAKAGLDDAAGGASKFQSALSNMVGPAAAVLAGVGAFAVQAAKSASATQQAFGGLDAVFGSNAQQMKDWANTAATTMGLSASQYATGAAQMGAQLKNLGVPMDQVGTKTNDLMQLSADLAATFGGTTTEAVTALSAALRGEADPAERYGLSLGAAAVKAQMAADGTDKLTGAAAQQAKAQAILKLATEQSAGAVGQFARESDSAAGAGQVATAQWENAKSALGEELLPILAQLATWLAKVATFVTQNSTAFQILAVIIVVVAAAILVAAAAQWVMNAALLAFPGTWIVLAIVAVIAIIALLWFKCEGFRNVVMAVWNAIVAAWNGIIAAMARVVTFYILAWGIIIGAIQSAYARIVAIAVGIGMWFVNAWNLIKTAALIAWNLVVAIVTAVVQRIIAFAMMIARPYIVAFQLIKMIAQLVFQLLRLGFELVRAVAVAIANQIKSVWTAIFNAIRSVASAVFSAIVGFIRPIASVARSVAAAAKSVFVAAWNAIKSLATAVFNAIRAVITKLTAPARAAANAIKAAFSAAWNAIKSAATALGAAIASVFRRAQAVVSSVVNQIKSSVLRVFSALRSAASGLGAALSAPFRAVASAVSSAISRVQSLISWLSRIKVPKISLPGGKSAPATMSTGGQLTTAPTARLTSGARLGTSGRTSGAVVVNVTGALDPDAVARQIQRLLSASDRRKGGVTLGRRAMGTAAVL